MTRLALGLLALATLLPLVAQDPAPRRDPGPRRGPDRVARHLGLSADQQARLRPLQAAHREATQKAQASLRAAREALQAALRDPATPVERLKELHATLSGRRFELATLQHQHRASLQALLSPDQREQAARLQGRMEGRRAGRLDAAFEGPRGPRMGRRDSARMEGRAGQGHGFARLQLEDAQATKLAEIRGRHAATLLPLQEQVRQAGRRLAEAARAANTPPATLKTLHETASQKQLDLLLARRAQHQEMAQVLTPEQRERLAQTRPDREGRRREGRPGRGRD